MRVSRRGALLAEALCALALAGVLAAVAGVALGAARRALATTDALTSAERAGQEAAAIAVALLRDADSLALLADTGVAFALPVATGVVCALEPEAIWLPPVRARSGRPFTLRAQPVEAGDLVRVLVVDSVAVGARWVGDLVVDTVTERIGSPGCDAGDGWVAAEDAAEVRLRLRVTGPLPADLAIGAPVRVARRGRLALYHAGGGDWMLGWRRCASDGAGCGAIQPVAGPLRSPAAGGFRLARDAEGTLTVQARGVPPALPHRRVVPDR